MMDYFMNVIQQLNLKFNIGTHKIYCQQLVTNSKQKCYVLSELVFKEGFSRLRLQKTNTHCPVKIGDEQMEGYGRRKRNELCIT